MKRIHLVAMVLALIVLVFPAALAETTPTVSGNAANDGFIVADAEGTLYFSRDGVCALHADGTFTRLNGDDAHHLSLDNGVLYYVARTRTDGDEYDPVYSEEIVALTLNGNVRRVIAPATRMGYESDYGDDDYSAIIRADTYPGYAALTLCDGYLYYIGADGNSGSYVSCAANWEGEGEVRQNTVSYNSGTGVFRMKTDGSDVVELISGLGNAMPAMAIANGRIAVASAWKNAVFSYDFTNFKLYDMDGQLLSTVKNPDPERHSGFYSEDTEFTVIVDAIQTDGSAIYASLSDSEGDFAAARLVNVEDINTTLVLEAYFNPALVLPTGIVYVSSANPNVYYTDGMENTLGVSYLSDGETRLLASIPADYAYSQLSLNALDDMIYLRTKDDLVRVPLAGGTVEVLQNGAFVASEEYAADTSLPQLAFGTDTVNDYGDYLLADSDTRLYTADELSGYDADTLALMRNEILARHGYPFQKDKYREYFGAQSWYVRNEDFSYGMLNAVETANVETIKALEK